MPSRRPRIHLVNPFVNLEGGSELRTLTLYDLLKDRARVRLWCPPTAEPPDPRILARYPVRRLRPRRLQVPWGGTVVFVGPYFTIGRWLRLSRPRRVVLVYNIFGRSILDGRLAELEAAGVRDRTEFVFASALVRDWAGLPGVVEPSPIDVEAFRPAPSRPDRPFTIGRLSRDTPNKHHPDDPALYRRLAAAGFRVRVMGGTCLAEAVGEVPGVELLPVGAEPAEAFLQSLDVFFYRRPEGVYEPFGRIVFEAMACGLPVVAYRTSGYAEYLEDGRTGFLFETTAEAEALLHRLRDDPERHARAAEDARAAVEALYGAERQEKTAAFYLR